MRCKKDTGQWFHMMEHVTCDFGHWTMHFGTCVTLQKNQLDGTCPGTTHVINQGIPGQSRSPP